MMLMNIIILLIFFILGFLMAAGLGAGAKEDLMMENLRLKDELKKHKSKRGPGGRFVKRD